MKSDSILKMRKSSSHKGENGRVMIIGGSIDYVGAPALSGLAALRSGCDIVNIFAPTKIALAINSLSPDLITTKFSGSYLKIEHTKSIKSKLNNFDAILIGPGISNKSKTAINNIIKHTKKENTLCVIDADAIKAANMKNISNSILTPHITEFCIFLKNNKLKSLAEKIFQLHSSDSFESVGILIHKKIRPFFDTNVILLKGKNDIIISKDSIQLIKGGNAGMTVGGTGDILAGLTVGYLSQTKDLTQSAFLASTNCKKIGDHLLKKSNFGFGFIASDFLKEIRKLNKKNIFLKSKISKIGGRCT